MFSQRSMISIILLQYGTCWEYSIFQSSHCRFVGKYTTWTVPSRTYLLCVKCACVHTIVSGHSLSPRCPLMPLCGSKIEPSPAPTFICPLSLTYRVKPSVPWGGCRIFGLRGFTTRATGRSKHLTHVQYSDYWGGWPFFVMPFWKEAR